MTEEEFQHALRLARENIQAMVEGRRERLVSVRDLCRVYFVPESEARCSESVMEQNLDYRTLAKPMEEPVRITRFENSEAEVLHVITAVALCAAVIAAPFLVGYTFSAIDSPDQEMTYVTFEVASGVVKQSTTTTKSSVFGPLTALAATLAIAGVSLKLNSHARRVRRKFSSQSDA